MASWGDVRRIGPALGLRVADTDVVHALVASRPALSLTVKRLGVASSRRRP